uniref:Phospholipase A2 n=1 Tax=Castor canadensis TaxID=51338 RepID=A0A8B7W4L2_CASCN|nr:group IIF secretory phospholipase A2 [Castor canadensis]
MADGAQANPKGFRKKVLVRRSSEGRGPSLRASPPWRISRSSLGVKKFIAIAVLAGSALSVPRVSSRQTLLISEAPSLILIRHQCCHAHDCCYQKLFDQGCRPYVDHYDHTIENDTVVVCSELNETECDKQTCECDKSVALCLKNQTYREQYRGYLNIYCQGPTPNCSIYDPLPEEITCGHHPPVTLAPP